MPLRSQAQAAYLKANDPSVFAEFKSETPKGARLPYKVKNPKKTKRVLRGSTLR